MLLENTRVYKSFFRLVVLLFVLSIFSNPIRRFLIGPGTFLGLRLVVSALVRIDLICFVTILVLNTFRSKALTWMKVSSFLMILIGVILSLLNFYNYDNFTYTVVGLSYNLSIRLIFYGFVLISQLLLIESVPTIVKYLRLLFKKVIEELSSTGPVVERKAHRLYRFSTLLVLGYLIILILPVTGTFKDLSSQARDYSTIFNNEYKYILAMKNDIDENCPIIHPPFDDKFPKEERWSHIKTQPILRFFLFPRVLINPVVFDMGMKEELLSKYRNFCFVKVTESNTVWPVIDAKEKTVSFDRYGKYFFKLDSVERVINSDGIEVYKITFKK